MRRQPLGLLKEIVFEVTVFVAFEADEDTNVCHIDLPLTIPGSFYSGGLL